MTTEEILFFDRLSTVWDDNEMLSTPEKINEILSLIKIEEGNKVLDLGTGTGVLLPYLSGLVGENGEVVGVDISGGMLNKAKEKYNQLPNVTFVKKDFEKEELVGKYEVIMLYCVYPHLHTPELTLKKLIGNNLADEGRIIISFPTDEKFINNIHKERKAESELLPSAPELSSKLNLSGLSSSVKKYDEGHYIVEIIKS